MKTKSQRAKTWAERNQRKSANRKHAHDKKRNRTNSDPTKRGTKTRDRHFDKRILGNIYLRPKDIPAAKALVLEQICDHGGPTEACVRAGVGRATFYDWLHEEDGVFRKAYNRARAIWRASMIGDVERSFGERAQFRDTLAGIFLLKHNTKRYREVSRLELSGPDGGPIVTADARDKLIERLDKLLDRAQQKPQLTAGSVEVHSIESSPAVGVRKAGSAGSAGSRRARGVSYG